MISKLVRTIIISIIVLAALAVLGLFVWETRIIKDQKKRFLVGYVEQLKSDSDSTTPLHIFVELGDVAATKIVLEKGAPATVAIDVNAVDSKGMTPLERAARYSRQMELEMWFYKPDIKIAKRLIAHGADINGKYGGPLQGAIQYQKPDFVKLLIDSGADINKQDDHGNTPLHHAITFGYTRKDKTIIQMLLKAGARKDIKNNEGQTPLDYENDWENAIK